MEAVKKINILGFSTFSKQKSTAKEAQSFKVGLLVMVVTIPVYVQSHDSWSWYYTCNNLIYLKLWKFKIGSHKLLHHYTPMICNNNIIPVRRKSSKCLWSRSHWLDFKEKYLPIFLFCNIIPEVKEFSLAENIKLFCPRGKLRQKLHHLETMLKDLRWSNSYQMSFFFCSAFQL